MEGTAGLGSEESLDVGQRKGRNRVPGRGFQMGEKGGPPRVRRLERSLGQPEPGTPDGRGGGAGPGVGGCGHTQEFVFILRPKEVMRVGRSLLKATISFLESSLPGPGNR